MVSTFQDVATRFAATPKRPEPQAAMVDFLIAISKGVDLLEGRSLRHGMKVAAIAGSIAKQMALTPREITSIVYAGLLHDVGLAYVTADFYPHLPEGMSEKEAYYSHAMLNSRVVGVSNDKKFSHEAQQILNTHPQASANFIESIHLSQDIKEIVATHHELCDGSGYPFGLTTESIPLGGRILAFADTVEAVMAEVSGLTTRKLALESFLDIKTAQKFDPVVVDTFRRMMFDETFLRQLYSIEITEILSGLCEGRSQPLTGKMILDISRAFGKLPDALLPQYTQHHAEKVAHYALRMANYLDIPQEQCGELIIASLLHDVGKLVIPMSILTKQGPLSDPEWELVHQHSHFTEEILKNIPTFETLTTWAGEHHERMNGRGYPAKKKGFEISLGGRIIGLADVFDVLVSSRPYRPEPYEPIDALPILGQGRYRLYDSQLVSVLRNIVLETEIVLR
ncbi:MAG: HD domain-containing protein [Cyanobacteria bacterium]|nr:HD domain-containing protein [Cyanobacteriota bacterium]